MGNLVRFGLGCAACLVPETMLAPSDLLLRRSYKPAPTLSLLTDQSKSLCFPLGLSILPTHLPLQLLHRARLSHYIQLCPTRMEHALAPLLGRRGSMARLSCLDCQQSTMSSNERNLDHCRSSQLHPPVFNIVSDRRGMPPAQKSQAYRASPLPTFLLIFPLMIILCFHFNRC